MELKTGDVYRIECGSFLSDDLTISLFSLYQPLIGRDAAALYMTLYSEGCRQKTQETHARLLAILNMSIDDLERARIRLEEYLLLRVFMQTQETRTSYVYVLNAPLSVSSFLAQKELTGLLAAALGGRQMELTAAKLQPAGLPGANYKEITRAVSHARRSAGLDRTVDYSRPEKRYRFSDEETEINFDYERFLTQTSTLVFPAELRTRENMQLIGQLATVYGLSADRMRILVMRCININTMTFDAEKLKVLCQKTQPDVTQAKDPYSLPPVSFLQARQNGAPVSVADRRILENLSLNMKFSGEVINIMIEYILRVSQNRLVKSFVDMVAGEWARDGVKTREQAFAAARKTPPGGGGGRKAAREMPEYYERVENSSEEKASDEQLQEVQEMMKRMGRQ